MENKSDLSPFQIVALQNVEKLKGSEYLCKGKYI